ISPVQNQPPSKKAPLLASALLWYPRNTNGPLRHNSPGLPTSTSFPSSSIILASILGINRDTEPVSSASGNGRSVAEPVISLKPQVWVINVFPPPNFLLAAYCNSFASGAAPDMAV